VDETAKLKQRIRRLERARDAWKKRAVSKQQHIRSLSVKARDLAASRDRWKEEARRALPGGEAQDAPPRLLPLPAPGDRERRGGKGGRA
jgi:hypothetical protein